jgi:hypothetical protein
MKINFEKYSSKICDCHVHFGQFKEDNYKPNQIINWFNELGIDKVGIMSVGTSWERDFEKDKKTMLAMPRKRFIPYLLVSPGMYDLDKTLNTFDSLRYKVIKIHSLAREEWFEMPNKVRGIIKAAYKKKVPVMFHTGGWRGSNAIQFYKFCREFQEVTFILAHGRPISQTLTVLKGANNAYVDSSFLPIENIKMICDAGLSDRIIFGTDFPVMKTFWPKINLVDWYKTHVMELIREFGEKKFMIWANENFYKLIFNK